MPLNRLDQITINVEDLDASVAWYGDLVGMDVLSRRDGEVDLGVASDHVDLTLVAGGKGLDSFAFGVADSDALNFYAGRLRDAGVASERASDARFGAADVLRFTLPTGHSMELLVGAGGRQAGEHNESWDGASTAPLDVDHMSLLTDDLQTLREFLALLDFRDSILFAAPGGAGLLGIWSHTTDYHHDLAYMALPGVSSGMHHLSVKVDGIHHMQLVADKLADGGHLIEFGPGHHPAANLFMYALDPSGNRVEFAAEMTMNPFDGPAIDLDASTPMNAWSPYVPETFFTHST